MYWVVVQWHSFYIVLLRPGALGLNRAKNSCWADKGLLYGSEQHKGYLPIEKVGENARRFM